MLNHITVQGRLVRDPELRKLPSGRSVTSVSIACDRDFVPKEGGERETDFIDVVAFGGTADHMAKFFTKGKMIIVSGRLQFRNWTDKDGNKRRNAEVAADSLYFCDSKKSDQGDSAYQAQNAYPGSTGDFTQGAQDFTPMDDDDAQLPF